MFGCSAFMAAGNEKSEQSEDTCSFDASLAELWHKELEGEEGCVELSGAQESSVSQLASIRGPEAEPSEGRRRRKRSHRRGNDLGGWEQWRMKVTEACYGRELAD